MNITSYSLGYLGVILLTRPTKISFWAGYGNVWDELLPQCDECGVLDILDTSWSLNAVILLPNILFRHRTGQHLQKTTINFIPSPLFYNLMVIAPKII
jgi:hypothetical protein